MNPASLSLADLAMKRYPSNPFSPGRNAAPSGEPGPLHGAADEDSPAPLGGGYIIHCAAGMPTATAFWPQGKYLGWIGGQFIPACHPRFAKRYATRAIARAVATRAEQAYPGARFEVVAADAEAYSA
jgi:hypothetical protein